MNKKDYVIFKQSQIDSVRKRKLQYLIVRIFVIIVGVLLLMYICTDGFIQWSSHKFELLSPLISSVALVVAYSAFYIQKVEMDIQVESSKQKIGETIEYVEQMKQLLKTISIKNELEQIEFREHMFRSAISSLTIRDDKTDAVYQGVDVFKYLFLEYPYEYSNSLYNGLFEFLKGPGDGAYNKSESLRMLNPYFDLFYELIKYITSCVFLEKDDKDAYVNTIKSRLSEFEIIMVYYHGLMRESGPLRKLIEKYAMLEDINFDYMIADNNNNHYEESAFGCNGPRYRKKREEERAKWPCNNIKSH